MLTQVHSHLPKKYVRPSSRRSGIKTHYFSMADLEELSLAQMFGPKRVAPSTDAYLSDFGSKFRKLVDDFEFRVQYGLGESGYPLRSLRESLDSFLVFVNQPTDTDSLVKTKSMLDLVKLSRSQNVLEARDLYEAGQLFCTAFNLTKIDSMSQKEVEAIGDMAVAHVKMAIAGSKDFSYIFSKTWKQSLGATILLNILALK